MTTDDEKPIDPDAATPPLWRSLLPAFGAIAAIALFAAHLPPRFKLLLIFPIAVGSVAGTVVAYVLRTTGPRTRATTIAVAAGLVPLAQLGCTAESYRQWRADKRADIQAHLLSQPGGRDLFDRVTSGKPPANAVEADLLRPYRVLLNPTPAEYLVARLGNVTGKLRPDATVAAGFAAIELLLGWAAGVAVATRVFVTSAGREETS